MTPQSSQLNRSWRRRRKHRHPSLPLSTPPALLIPSFPPSLPSMSLPVFEYAPVDMNTEKVWDRFFFIFLARDITEQQRRDIAERLMVACERADAAELTEAASCILYVHTRGNAEAVTEDVARCLGQDLVRFIEEAVVHDMSDSASMFRWRMRVQTEAERFAYRREIDAKQRLWNTAGADVCLPNRIKLVNLSETARVPLDNTFAGIVLLNGEAVNLLAGPTPLITIPVGGEIIVERLVFPFKVMHRLYTDTRVGEERPPIPCVAYHAPDGSLIMMHIQEPPPGMTRII